MALAQGSKVGRFEIRSQLGAGGMGEVYRARDPNIDRDVAVKILPDEFSTDPRRLQRFELEARATGRLNHPNILAIHDIDLHNGVPFVVYELLEGETLRERLNRGSLSQRRVVDYSLQIARGLAAAHAKGIVHRDLKPENIFITTDEHVKILDFGLAKLFESADGEKQSDIATRKVNTTPGAVMGTVGYMSPEQVRGELVDHRSDIFALGVIVYEMISGQRAFRGDSAVETLNAILKEDPPDITTRSNVHPSFNRVMRRCLEKRPEERFQSACDFAFALEAISEGSQANIPHIQTSPVTGKLNLKYAAVLLSAILVVGLIAALVLFYPKPATNLHASRFLVYPPENSTLSAGDLPFPVAVSPDGELLALVMNTGGQNHLWLRRLDSLKTQQIPHTEGARNPFWSPDSRFIGFFANGKLKKIATSGGVPVVICDAPPNANSGTWNQEDTILFTTGVLEKGILRVSANGGEPVEVTKRDQSRNELVHFWPHFLPDGRHFLYLVTFNQRNVPFALYVASLDSTEKKEVPNVGSRAMYAPPGYLLYVRDGALLAQPFDLKSFSLSGEQSTIAEPVGNFSRTGNSYFSVSANGEVLAYVSSANASRLVILNDKGSEERVVGTPNDYIFTRLSPDGSKFAVNIANPKDGTNDIWIYDLTRNTFTKFTFDPGMSNGSVWSPDGQRIVYSHDLDGPPHLFVKSFNDSNEGQMLLPPRGSGPEHATDWSLDGKFLIYGEYYTGTNNDLMVLPMSGERVPQPFLQTAFNESEARFSPDGKWVAYSSDESGKREVYVKAFPGGAERFQISTNGGRGPRWSRDGKMLFYLSPEQKVMSVAIRMGNSLEAGTPSPLFSIATRAGDYDVFPDGKRFLINTNSGAPALPLTVATHWAKAIK